MYVIQLNASISHVPIVLASKIKLPNSVILYSIMALLNFLYKYIYKT